MARSLSDVTRNQAVIATRVRANVNLRCSATWSDVRARMQPGQQTLPEPIVLIEILSPGNASQTWDNVWSYTTIPSVREILVVHSTRRFAELLRRDADGNWPAEPEEIGPGGTLAARQHRLCLPLARHLCADASCVSPASRSAILSDESTARRRLRPARRWPSRRRFGRNARACAGRRGTGRREPDKLAPGGDGLLAILSSEALVSRFLRAVSSISFCSSLERA